jgi:Zn-dependent protease
MVMFPLLSYIAGGWMMGWASAPYDPNWAQRYPRRAAWMSLAGPCANFTLSLIAGICIKIGLMNGTLRLPSPAGIDNLFLHVVVPATPGFATGVATFLSLMFSLNLLLGLFNLLPIPPLDGFGVVGLFLPEDAARRFQHFGWSLRSWTFIGLLLAWRVFEPVFFPVFGFTLRMLYFG